MKKNKLGVVILLSSLLLSFFFNYEVVFADDGGVVQTKGDITFVDEGTSPSSTAPSTSSSSTDQFKRQPLDTVKPKGKLPSTGELVKTSLSVSGVLLLVIIGGLYFWKQKYRHKKERKG